MLFLYGTTVRYHSLALSFAAYTNKDEQDTNKTSLTFEKESFFHIVASSRRLSVYLFLAVYSTKSRADMYPEKKGAKLNSRITYACTYLLVSKHTGTPPRQAKVGGNQSSAS
mmetsp:Transcript_24757/g.36691  ORF Transcript_24757/g.36691 Transcript_24757/m.36691 type:complete len:112 (-) Transcript_24757:178-513(-)